MTFARTIVSPRDAHAEPALKDPHHKDAYPGLPKAMTLLVIEDESRLRDLLIDVAPDMGFTAVGARTAEEALRLMESQPRDVVILDLNLPAMDGMECFARLRERWPATQVIILTGFGDLEAARKAIHLGVVEFLTKPCPLNVVEQALDRARRRLDEARLHLPTAEQAPAPMSPPAISGETLEAHERRLILAALARNNGNRTATAAELGISRRTLHYRLQEYQKQGFPP
jgi:DNA-binding NtrC family response regulator